MKFLREEWGMPCKKEKKLHIAYIKQNTLNYYLTWLLEIMNYCAVDCFAMISAYVMINNKKIDDFYFSKIFKLWFNVFLYVYL